MDESIIQDVAERAFSINPDTVFGFLVGILVLAVIYLAYSLNRQNDKLVELNIDTITVLKELNTALLLMKEEGVQLGESVREQHQFTREHIRNLLTKMGGNAE